MKLLSEDEVQTRLASMTGWTREGDEIRRSWKLDSFVDAIAFVGRVADLAEAANHHPDIDIRYDRVVLSLSTHSAGGITEKDLRLAAQIDALGGRAS